MLSCHVTELPGPTERHAFVNSPFVESANQKTSKPSRQSQSLNPTNTLLGNVSGKLPPSTTFGERIDNPKSMAMTSCVAVRGLLIRP